jgi:outer membrane protein assembly factor BamB
MVIYSGQGKGTEAVKVVPQGDGFAVQEFWRNEKFGTVYNSPVLKDGRLFGLSDRGHFFCLNALTGQTCWAATNRVSNFGSLVAAGSVLLALPEKSGLIAFKPSDNQYEELARLPVSDTPVYAHPVVAGKSIYIKDSTTASLWLIE